MKKIIGAGLAFAPFLAFAEVLELGGTKGIVGNVTDFLGVLVPFILALAVLFVLFGVLQFVMSAGDEEGRKAAKAKMIWGIVGIIIMVSLYGIINFLTGELGLTDQEVVKPITLPAKSS